MKHIMLKSLLIILPVSIQISVAQFPTACMDANSLTDRKCCPHFDGSECGSEDGRGECKSITMPDRSMGVRDGWPYYFDHVCICAHNYSGYDCGRCKYGHYGVSCNSSQCLDRRPISEYTPKEWKEYVTILNLTKGHKSDYSVFLEEPSTLSSDPSQLHTSPIMLYSLFVWQHHYPAKDSEIPDKALRKDYAHESTGFLTWHRQFLLWFEWEVQYMLKDMGKEDYYMFRIPYWDWRKNEQIDKNSPFQLNRLGETVNNHGLPQVHGDAFSEFLNSWETICWEKKNKTFDICNPQVPTGQLQRCPLKAESCGSKNELWPSDDDVQTALSLQMYDTPPYNMNAANSFRNHLEGFKPLTNSDFQSCRDNKLCTCENGNYECTESRNGAQPRDPIQRLLHNSIHIILGLGYFGSDAFKNNSISGVMADVAASANDPIFLNHHAMVDCIFETWLQNNRNVQYPKSNDSDIPPGHRFQDYIVPFFPLYTHGDMFATADKFGYHCTIIIKSNKHSSMLPEWAIILISAVSGVVSLGLGILACVCIIKHCCCKSCNKKTYEQLPDTAGQASSFCGQNS